MTIDKNEFPKKPIAKDQLAEEIFKLLKDLQPEDFLGIFKLARDAYKLEVVSKMGSIFPAEQFTIFDDFESGCKDQKSDVFKSQDDLMEDENEGEAKVVSPDPLSEEHSNENIHDRNHFIIGKKFQMHMLKYSFSRNLLYAKNVDERRVLSDKFDATTIEQKEGWYAFDNLGLFIYAILLRHFRRTCMATVGFVKGDGTPVITEVKQWEAEEIFEFCDNCVIFSSQLNLRN